MWHFTVRQKGNYHTLGYPTVFPCTNYHGLILFEARTAKRITAHIILPRFRGPFSNHHVKAFLWAQSGKFMMFRIKGS